MPQEKAGAASGLATTANDLGISLGVAVIGSIGAVRLRHVPPIGSADQASVKETTQ